MSERIFIIFFTLELSGFFRLKCTVLSDIQNGSSLRILLCHYRLNKTSCSEEPEGKKKLCNSLTPKLPFSLLMSYTFSTFFGRSCYCKRFRAAKLVIAMIDRQANGTVVGRSGRVATLSGCFSPGKLCVPFAEAELSMRTMLPATSYWKMMYRMCVCVATRVSARLLANGTTVYCACALIIKLDRSVVFEKCNENLQFSSDQLSSFVCRFFMQSIWHKAGSVPCSWHCTIWHFRKLEHFSSCTVSD